MSAPSVADLTFAALDVVKHAPDMTGARMELYLARVAIDHGQRALDAFRLGDETLFSAHLLAYGRITRGLIETGYWTTDGSTQVGWGQPCA